MIHLHAERVIPRPAEEVADFRPFEMIKIETFSSTFPLTITRSVEPIDEGTSRVRAEIHGSPGGLLGLLSPLTRRLAQRSVDADYDRLVELMNRD